MFAALAAVIVLFAPGIAPGSTTAAGGMQTLGMAVLSRARIAAGGPAVEQVRTLHLTERATILGMAGKAEEWDDVVTGSFVQTQSDMGPLSGTQGYDGKNAWTQDATGLTFLTDSGNNISNAVTQAYTTSLAYWFPERRAGTVVLTGKKNIDDRQYYVLRATPLGGYPIDLWFDTKTYLLARQVVTYAATRSAVTDFLGLPDRRRLRVAVQDTLPGLAGK